MRPLAYLVDVCTYFARALYGAMTRLQGLVHSTHQAQVSDVIRSTRHDMASDPDEAYYAAQYWHWISPALSRLPRNMTCLDLGCGQGRFAVKVAEHFPEGRVVGVDISAAAIAAARQRAVERHVEGRTTFVADDIEAFLERQGCGLVNLVLLTEVTFFWPSWREWLKRICDLLPPGGLVCIAFRSQYFDALCIARQGLWSNVPDVLRERKGRILGGKTVFTWQTSAEVRELLVGDMGLELVQMVGIGCASGLRGDPLDGIARPSLLDGAARQRLMELELSLGPTLPDAGRYMLAIASRPG